MKVFISSLITGFGSERQAVKRAVTTLRYEPIMAEDFGAQPNSPQIACLQGVRQADLVVLVLAESYGAVQPGSGLSATHEEYREARATKPVLAFVRQGVNPDPQQANFISEVQGWEGGLFRGGFTDVDDLQAGVTRALHDAAVASAVGPVDQAELTARAKALIPPENRNFVTNAALDLAITTGPTQRILRPVEIEAPDLAEGLLQAALFGPNRLFDLSSGNESGLSGGDLVIKQERGASIRLDEQGSLLLRLPLDEPIDRRQRDYSGMMVIIEEVVQQRLSAGLGYASDLIERVDPTQRLTHIAIAARISGAEHRGWRTRAQQAARPNSMTISMNPGEDRGPAQVSHRRAALRLGRSRIVEDLLVPLRRQFSQG